MKKKLFILSIFFIVSINTNILSQRNVNVVNNRRAQERPVIKKILSNGMTILVRPVKNYPKVSVQLWYGVGSKDESDSRRGIAHFIEHMLFGGTDKVVGTDREYSESDINVITHKLSGSCNAFTSHDYTGYLFNFPKQHWQEALPMMSSCMKSCAFKEDKIDSEIKAVIQELKMYGDNPTSSLLEQMISTIFDDHPYHYPIIGYKQDLWNKHSEDLKAFYKEHYHPNNATLVVVGDVDAQQVFKLAEQYFGSIEPNKEYKKEKFYFNKDIVSKSVTLYRDIKQPLVVYAFLVPGLHEKKDHLLELIAWIFGKGRGSRLYKKLVDDLQLVTSISAYNEDLFEHGLFLILCEPKKIEDITAIEQVIKDEITEIVNNGITKQELQRAVKQTQMGLYSLFESFENQAYQIGKYYLATGDENYIFNYLNQPIDTLQKDIHKLLTCYFRPTVMHSGKVLPLPDAEKNIWQELQKESDEEDSRILDARIRITQVEPPKYADKVVIKEQEKFDFPKAQTVILSNGLKVLYYHNSNTPKIDLALKFKAQYYYDPQDLQGLYSFMSNMLTEGTKNYTAEQLADVIESRGMLLGVYPGGLSARMLSDDFEFGMRMIEEVLSRPIFDQKKIEKVRAQMLADIKNYWDDPWDFSGQLLRDHLYKNHPYSKNGLGTQESVAKINRDHMVNFHKKYVSPHGATLVIVGDLQKYKVKDLLGKTIGKWKGEQIQEITFSELDKVNEQVVVHPINRDQVVLCLANLTIDRKHPDYDKFLLFDQIFGGGVLGSMSSRLFQLREQSGLFYRIKGSLIAGADEQPGMFLVKTTVSLDRLSEAEKIIKQTIDAVVDTIKEEELMQAKRAIANTLVDRFVSNRGTAAMFLFLDKYGFPADFFDTRASQLSKVSLDDIKKAVKKVMSSSKLLTLRVGRVKDVGKL